VLGGDFVEDDPEMVDEVDSLHGRQLGHDQIEVVDDDKRYRRLDEQLRLHGHAQLQTVRNRPVNVSHTSHSQSTCVCEEKYGKFHFVELLMVLVCAISHYCKCC